MKVTATGAIRTFVYHYDRQGQLISETREDGTPVRSYVWADNEPIAQIQYKQNQQTDQLLYVHTDHLATPRLATDATQAAVWRWESQAFGQGQPDNDPDDDSINSFVRLRMPGQYYDGESGLFYNWNRYYDPKVGRYVTSDPIGLGGGLNTYAYVDSNPLRWIDPEGLKKVCRYVIGDFYWKDVPVKVQDEMGYYDTICVPIPQPSPGVPGPTRRRGPRGGMGAYTDLFDVNFRKECRTRWIQTQEEKWEMQSQMWVRHWIKCTDTCTGETTTEYLPDQRASDPMPAGF